ncbi:MAG: hypothetical protein A4E49_02231 [Methanosaeta sp. PtaU1.Bin112]|nr:MAG: hypothetical protein A4E49_02231 [Methanosaeta sp. PtaU1.Bin112]
MEDFSDRYGSRFIKLVDRRGSGKEFEFDQALLMPTAAGYRALVEQARAEIKPRVMSYLSRRWSQGTIENLSFFAMAAAVYARSICDPPLALDVGKVLLRTVAFCNRRCAYGKGFRGGCRLAMNRAEHHLPKCIKIPRDIAVVLSCLKRYIATGKEPGSQEAASVQRAMSVKVDPGLDYAPATSC